jgi:uncharacterized protein YpuA (DUF1002 family)
MSHTVAAAMNSDIDYAQLKDDLTQIGDPIHPEDKTPPTRKAGRLKRIFWRG